MHKCLEICGTYEKEILMSFVWHPHFLFCVTFVYHFQDLLHVMYSICLSGLLQLPKLVYLVDLISINKD